MNLLQTNQGISCAIIYYESIQMTTEEIFQTFVNKITLALEEDGFVSNEKKIFVKEISLQKPYNNAKKIVVTFHKRNDEFYSGVSLTTNSTKNVLLGIRFIPSTFYVDGATSAIICTENTISASKNISDVYILMKKLDIYCLYWSDEKINGNRFIIKFGIEINRNIINFTLLIERKHEDDRVNKKPNSEYIVWLFEENESSLNKKSQNLSNLVNLTSEEIWKNYTKLFLKRNRIKFSRYNRLTNPEDTQELSKKTVKARYKYKS